MLWVKFELQHVFALLSVELQMSVTFFFTSQVNRHHILLNLRSWEPIAWLSKEREKGLERAPVWSLEHTF